MSLDAISFYSFIAMLTIISLFDSDPQDNIDFADALYNDDKFLTTLHTALADDGVLVIQVGASPNMDEADERLTKHKNRAIMIDHLEKLGFTSMHIYAEGHSGFFDVWNYLVVTKKLSSRGLWYQNEAEINLAIRKRIIPTKSGLPSLRYFDGSTLLLYQRPTKRVETVFCRRIPTPFECTYDSFGFGFEPRRPNIDLSHFEVRMSLAGEKAGRGLFSKVDIPVGTFLSIEQVPHSVYFPPGTYKLIDEMVDFLEDSYGVFHHFNMLDYYMSGYGFSRQYHVSCQGHR